MEASTAANEVLFVTDGTGDPATVARHLGLDEETAEVRVARTVGECHDRLAAGPVDCLLCGADVPRDRCLDLVRSVRSEHASVPVLVFTGDRGDSFVAEVIEAGASDVVQSTLAATPESLVRGRIGSLVDGHRDVGRSTDLRKRDEMLRHISENITDIVWITSPDDGEMEFVSGAYEEVFGRPRAELVEDSGVFLDAIHPEDRERVREALAVRQEDPDAYDETYRVVRPDGTVRWIHDRAFGVYEDGSLERIVGVAQDVTEEKRRKEKIERQRDDLAQLARLNAVIRDVDQALVGATTREEIEQVVCERLTEAGRYRFALALRAEGDGRLVPAAWTDAGEAFVDAVFPVEDVSPDTSPGLRALETGEAQVVQSVGTHPDLEATRDAALDAGIESLANIPVGYEDRTYGVIGVYADEQGAFGRRELRVLEELGETVGYAVAAVERREREQTLTSLYEASRALLGAETQREVSDVVVDVAADVLDLSGVGIFLFDDEANELRPVSATEELLAFYGDSTVFGPGNDDSEAWYAYATGEPRVFDDIRNSERVANPETDARSSLVLPLGEHGVFVAADTAAGVFDDGKRRLVGLLAATAETALDRVAGQERARERDRALADRTRRLERLTDLLDLLREVQGSVLRARSREGIERAVCERLVADGPATFAWVGTVAPDDETVTPRTWAGGEGEYLDGVSLTLAGDEPAARAATAGSPVVVSNVTDHLREQAWARAATERGFQSVVAVPLPRGDTTRGVLAVYADTPDAFDGTTTDVLCELGELVAYSLAAVETRRGVLADRVVELELGVPDPGTFLNAVADVAGEPVRYLDLAPEPDGRVRVRFLTEVPPEDVLALETEFVGVESLRHVRNGDSHLFSATVTGRPLAAVLVDCGAIPVEIRAGPDETTAVVALPTDIDVRTFVDRVRATYPGTELRSRRERSRRDRREQAVRRAFESELTDRQREVLALAYEAGYFESPRVTSGVDLADRLDISQPTLTHHLREGQRRLFAALFGDDA